jgi:hypothetical protein
MAEKLADDLRMNTALSRSVAAVCRRSWKRTCGTPARAFSRVHDFPTIDMLRGRPSGREKTKPARS